MPHGCGKGAGKVHPGTWPVPRREILVHSLPKTGSPSTREVAGRRPQLPRQSYTVSPASHWSYSIHGSWRYVPRGSLNWAPRCRVIKPHRRGTHRRLVALDFEVRRKNPVCRSPRRRAGAVRRSSISRPSRRRRLGSARTPPHP
jgi:hypothetical protein